MSCLLRWAVFLWIVHTIPCIVGMAVNERIDNSRCPPLKVDKDRFSYSLNGPQPEFTGFDLTETFLLRKGTVTDDQPSFRLGSSPLIKPTELVFPNGLSSEYSLVTTFRLRKTTKKDRWYLWQIFDQTGGTQVSVVLDGAKRAVEFSARGLLKNSLHYTFKSRDLHALFDRQWHKLGVAVQSSIVSIYMDCKQIERRVTDEKEEINTSGYTLITTRVEDGRPVDIELQQILIYCDPYLAEMENCCERAGSTCESSREGPGTRGVTPNPLVTDGAGQLGYISSPLSQPVQPAQVQRVQHSSSDRCQCSAEKGDQDLPGLAGLPGQKGDQGNKGDQGISGFPGLDGLPGQKGEAGSNGSKGIDGAMGEKGSAGEPGTEGKPGINDSLAGPIGPKGDQGDSGLQGLPGLSMEKEGLKGDQGSPGLPGQMGAPGKDGKRGRRGKTGELGPRGLPGVKGDSGIPGDKGDQGDQGQPGGDGASGMKGQKGEEGLRGPPGPVMTAHGLLTGSEAEAGEKGQKGEMGDLGQRGFQGPHGLKGSLGLPGPKGEPGPEVNPRDNQTITREQRVYHQRTKSLYHQRTQYFSPGTKESSSPENKESLSPENKGSSSPMNTQQQKLYPLPLYLLVEANWLD